MSASPSKDLEGEVGVQSPDEQEHMDQPETSQQQPAFDFEVKEQDRWLPIANGESSLLPIYLCLHLPVCIYACGRGKKAFHTHKIALPQFNPFKHTHTSHTPSFSAPAIRTLTRHP